jgi:8-amino-7-oxononanoate synthase
VAAATRAALRLVREEGERREHLQNLVQRFRAGAQSLGLELWPSVSAIQPIIVGDDARALRLTEALRRRGFWISAIRPPTVPEGTARLRVTLSAAHTEAQVDGLLEALAESWREMGEAGG